MHLLRDTFLVYRRQLKINLTNPAWVLIGIFQPILYLVFFGPLLKPLTSNFGVTNAYTFFVPGLLIQLSIFGAMFAGFSVIDEYRRGVIDAEKVTPATRTALLLGRVGRDLTQLIVQSVILVILGYFMGLRGSVPGILLGLLIAVLLGSACSALSYAFALKVKSEDVMAPVTNMILMPILLLSGIMLPMNIGPHWLKRISDFIPFKYIVSGDRDLFLGNLWSSNVFWAFFWTLILLGLGILAGTRVFNKSD